MIPRLDNLDRNYIINGGMDYSQRIGLTTATVDASNTYHLDRWLDGRNASFNVNPLISKTISSMPNNKTKNVASFTNTEVTDSTALVNFEQRIESINAIDLKDKIISFSMYQQTDSWQQARLVLSTANAEDDFSTVTEFYNQTIVLNNLSVWENIKFENITTPNSTGNGVSVRIELSNPSIIAAIMDFKLGEIKLSIGLKAQEFSNAGRDVAEELQLCQRYFEKSYNLDDAPSTITQDGAMMTICGGNAFFTVGHSFSRKRAVPVVTTYNPSTGGSGTWRNNSAGNNPTASPTRVGENSFSVANSGGASHQIVGHFTVDAEL